MNVTTDKSYYTYWHIILHTVNMNPDKLHFRMNVTTTDTSHFTQWIWVLTHYTLEWMWPLTNLTPHSESEYWDILMNILHRGCEPGKSSFQGECESLRLFTLKSEYKCSHRVIHCECVHLHLLFIFNVTNGAWCMLIEWMCDQKHHISGWMGPLKHHI